MADVLGGDTIHHALNLPLFGKIRITEFSRTHEEVAKQLLQWRWLISAEII